MLPNAVVVARTRTAPDLPTGADLPGGCVYEPRWAGRRALLFLLPPAGPGRARACLLRSRTGEDLGPGREDVLAAAVAQLPAGTVLDGALVETGALPLAAPAPCRDLVPQRWPRAVGGGAGGDGAGEPHYVAVDLLAAPGGRDVREQPWHVRRGLLEDLLTRVRAPLHLTPATGDEGCARAWLSDAAARVDGLVAKGRAQPYRPGSRAWVAFRPVPGGRAACSPCPRAARPPPAPPAPCRPPPVTGCGPLPPLRVVGPRSPDRVTAVDEQR
ncbi:hypothetical protein CLV92_102116 [Kineococcus xinjiangensis]|uniref:ATP dependent DNA ligase-like protein n=1 Tax=Kineococcus xinjiangensis TaxID=512762 RepID=A0A2S6IUK6_9ACTN|nr:hypothetical protein [Kineococcus xinjiangensis]PPK97965.1 hypothetical protein CLV92_102116 [Kineococcus xinjiangensis]